MVCHTLCIGRQFQVLGPYASDNLGERRQYDSADDVWNISLARDQEDDDVPISCSRDDT